MGLTIAAVSVVSLPALPLIPLIYTSQVVNAVLLPLHVIALQVLAGDAVGHGCRAVRDCGRGWRVG